MERQDSHLGALVGPGRSGTTWAGTLIDSSPDVVYRFEPFHRLAKIDSYFRDTVDRFKRCEIGHSDIARMYGALLRASPLTNKPPYFLEKSYRLASFGRNQLWPAARVLAPMRWLYAAAYSPAPGPPVIFKEVTFVRATQNLIKKTKVPVAYIVRHPCATVMSEVRGQSDGKMPVGRQHNLRKLLSENAPHLAEKFADVLADSDPVRRVALLWRYEVESIVPLVQSSASGAVFSYEKLASDTHSETRRLLAHFGLAYSAQTERYVDSLMVLKARDEPLRRTGWGNRYYSVYRNPLAEKDAWKARISSDDRRRIEAIVEGSEAFRYCARLGSWD